MPQLGVEHGRALRLPPDADLFPQGDGAVLFLQFVDEGALLGFHAEQKSRVGKAVVDSRLQRSPAAAQQVKHGGVGRAGVDLFLHGGIAALHGKHVFLRLGKLLVERLRIFGQLAHGVGDRCQVGRAAGEVIAQRPLALARGKDVQVSLCVFEL